MWFSKLTSLLFIGFIRLYQGIISPYLGRSCRYSPTCSQYTIEAIQLWGPFKGLWIGLKRISRCHPWGGHGYDPVPMPKPNHRQKELTQTHDSLNESVRNSAEKSQIERENSELH